MSRRNFILFIIVLLIIGVFFLLYFYSRPTPNGAGGDNGGFFSNLNPFGKSTVVKPKPTGTDNNNNNFPNTTEPGVKNKLIKVSSMPIAGYTSFEKEKLAGEFHPSLRYVDRATGNIYQTFADEIQERKFSNTIIPKVYEAFFGNNGNTVLMRYLKNDDRTIQTFIGTLPPEKLGDDSIITNDVQGTFLPDNITDLSISPDGTKVFYLLEQEGGVVGIVLNIADSKKTQVFDSPYTEWLSNWMGSKAISLTTKASGFSPSYIYGVDLVKKYPIKLLGDITGMTSLASPTGKNLIFGDKNLTLKTYDLGTRASTILSVRTEPEKCTWDKGGVNIYCAIPKNTDGSLYPDSWYQGETSFNDELWKIDTTTNTANILVDPAVVVGEEIDGIKLSLDANEKYLFFVNKKDSFLWEFDLSN